MKKKLQLALLLIISIINFSIAQVSEEEKAMSTGINNAIVVSIPDVSAKIAEDVWKDYMKQYKGKTKKNRKSDEWTTTNANMVAFAEEPVTVYAQIEEATEEVILTMWVPMAEGFLSSEKNPEQYTAAEKMLNEYALEVKIETTKARLKGEEKTFSKLEKDLKKLEKDNSGYHKDIKDAEKRIVDSKKGLIRNAEDQEEAVENVRTAEDYFAIKKDALEDLLSEASEKDEKKSIKKMIKGEEKKVKEAKSVQKKAEKEESKLRKTIQKSKETIRDSEAKIVVNVKDQEVKTMEIEKQKEVVSEVNDHLKKLYDEK